MEIDIQAISLREFNARVARQIAIPTLQNCWVVAELSDVGVRGGHCYLELVEKDPDRGTTIAKARGIIWANVFQTLKYNFESTTGQSWASGIKVMVRVSANFHEQFGFSLVINAVNPDFTLGDMARKRIEIIRRLTAEGIIEMNRQIEICDIPQRIAIISSRSAAGYGDFMNQLQHNPQQIQFYTVLFEATMQGVNTAPSIIAALDRIFENIDLFDCVVIIRGGGATSELNAFDDYDLAAHIAQFPIPIITGVGHERDTTVIDYVAHLRVKTPTAAAEWLIERGEQGLALINNLTQTIINISKDMIAGARQQMAYISSTIPYLAENRIENGKSELKNLGNMIPMCVQNRINNSNIELSHTRQNISQVVARKMEIASIKLESLNDTVKILSPENTLNRGYSLTMCSGKVVVDTSQVNIGDTITTRLKSGIIVSEIKND